MKQENKKSKKWLLPVLIAAILLIVTGVVLAFVLGTGGPSEQPEPEQVTSKLYWNVDRLQYVDAESGFSNREPGEDGLYHVRFAVDGEQKDFMVADKKLVNYMDSKDVMGLEFDADGNVIDVLDLELFATELALGFYVQYQEGNNLKVNSSVALNGMQQILDLSNVKVYDVRSGVEVVGAEGVAEPLDKVCVYGDLDENPTTVYIVERQPTADVYWRVERKYDSATAGTSRQPDENGVYTVLAALDGKQVEVKTKDKALVDLIDKGGRYDGTFAPLFDENGYMVELLGITKAIRGAYPAASYEITALDGSNISAEYQMTGTNQGKTWSGVMHPDCKVYNVSDGGTADVIGEATTLQVTDRANIYTNAKGEAVLIYVVNRMVEGPMYYNVQRKYSGGVTTRTPDANGYYVFKLAVDGKIKEFKTKDKDLASRVDSYSYSMFGLKVEGNIIKRAYNPECVTGYYSVGSNCTVTDKIGTIITLTNLTSGASTNPLMSGDCKVYNVSGVGKDIGAPDEIQIGDQIIAYTGPSGDLRYVYITSRYTGTPVFWNHTRKYSSVTEETTRKPDEEGYYVFRVASEGKDMTVRTKDKKLASKMDSYNPQWFSLKLSGDIVKDVYPVTAATGGIVRSSYFAVESISDTEIMTYSLYGSGKTPLKPAEKMQVYNISGAYEKQWGEKTTLKVDDQIHALTDSTGNAAVIYIRTRKVDSELYWNKTRMYNTVTAETTRKPDENGWYVFDLAVNGEVKQFKTKDKDLASRVDSNRVAFGLKLKGDVIQGVYSVTSVKGIKAQAVSWWDVYEINGNKITFRSNIGTDSTYGQTKEFTLAKNYVTYDVCGYVNPFGSKVQLEIGDRVQAYTNDDGEVSVIYIPRDNTRKEGGVAYCSHCDQVVTWCPWSGEALYKSDGHYHLTHDVKISKQITAGDTTGDTDPAAAEKYDIVIDLNGNTLTSANRTFRVCYGTELTIMDSVGGGALVAKGYNKSIGGNLLIQRGGKVNLEAGTLKLDEEANVPSSGGIIHLSGAESAFTMTGGEIIGGTVSASGGSIYFDSGKLDIQGGTISGGTAVAGGNIYVYQSKAATISGATIKDGKATTSVGGNIFVSSKGGLTLTNCEVSGGTAGKGGGNIYSAGVLTIDGGKYLAAQTTGTGPNICVETGDFTISGDAYMDGGVRVLGGKSFTMSGKPVIENKSVYFSLWQNASVKMNADGLEKGASVGIYSTTAFATSTDVTILQRLLDDQVFHADDTTKEIVINGNDLMIGYLGHCAHCNQEVAWYAWSGEALQKADGHYRLSKTVDIATQLIAGDTTGDTDPAAAAKYDIVIDLNGNTLTSANRTFRVCYGTELSIMDSVGGGALVGKGYNNSIGGNLLIQRGGKVNLLGGTLKLAEDAKTPSSGGIVHLSGTESAFTMTGGEIIGATVSANGGAIYFDSGKLEITGGTISGGTAVAGGNIYANQSKNGTINGAVIKDGNATTSVGGNIFVAAKGGLTLTNCEVSGGTTGKGGGNIYSAGTLTIDGGKYLAGQTTGTGPNICVETGDFTISGDAYMDGGVRVLGAKSFTMSGKPVIENKNVYFSLWMNAGVPMNVDGLEKGASVGIYNTSAFATDTDAAILQRLVDDQVFHADDTTKEIVISENGLMIGLLGNCAHCNQEVAWHAWSGEALQKADGHYRLIQNVDIAGQLAAGDTTPDKDATATPEAYDIVIDLNGNTLTSANRTFRVCYGTELTIMDSVGGGAMIAKGFEDSIGGNLLIQRGGKVNLLGGTLKMAEEANVPSSGGIVHLSGAESAFTMTGGEIIGTTVSASGGAIYFDSGKLEITGGTISGGTAVTGGNIYAYQSKNGTISGAVIKDGKATTSVGGNIYVGAKGGLTLTNCEVSGGTTGKGGGNIYSAGVLTIDGGKYLVAQETGIGPNICVETGDFTVSGEAYVDGGVRVLGAKSFTVSGKPVIENKNIYYSLWLSAGVKMNADGLEKGASVGIYSSTAFATSTDATILQRLVDDQVFLADDTGKTVVVSGNDLITANYHCVLGHTSHTGEYAGCTEELVIWTAWSNAESLPSESGYYYLTTNLKLGNQNVISNDITLDLNGHNITGTVAKGTAWASRRLASIAASGSLTITDLSDGEVGTISLVNKEATVCSGALFYVSGNLTLYNGVLDGSKLYSNTKGGTAIAVDGGTFTMYDGTIKGVNGANSADSNTNGSTICGWSGSTVNIHGGELIGSIGKNGANLYIACKLNITGGTFTGGKVSPGGVAENIYVDGASAEVVISGGTFNGAVYAQNFKSFQLTGTPVINKTETHGLYIPKGKLVNVDGLQAGAQITLTASEVFATGSDAAELAAIVENNCFQLDSAGMSVAVSGNKLVFACYRCILGHTEHTGDNAACTEELTYWKAWNDTKNLPTEDGSYYLTDNLELGNNITISNNINLDLNGFNITGTVPAGTSEWAARHLFTVDTGVTVAITDLTAEPGTISIKSNGQTVCTGALFHVKGGLKFYNGKMDAGAVSSNSENAVAIYVANGASFDMFGGSLKGVAGAISNGAKTNGSTVYVEAGATVNIHGGEVIGVAGKLGANMYIKGKLNITGGTFTGGNTGAIGVSENLYIDGAAEVVISGGTFNGAVYANNFASFQLTGAPVINKTKTYGLYVAEGKLVNVDGLQAEAKIDLTEMGAFATGTDAAELAQIAQSGSFRLEDVLTEVAVVGQNLEVRIVEAITRCAFGHTVHEGDNADCPAQIVEWKPWSQADSLPASGNYFLLNNVEIGNNTTFSENVMLDLNGYNITGTATTEDAWATRRLFVVAADKTVGITDLSETQSGKISLVNQNATTCSGALFYCHGDLVLYSGTLDGSNLASNTNGGAAIAVDGSNFTMYGGTLKGVGGATSADSATNGSAICAWGGTVNIHGGELVGKSGKLGGNVYVSGTALNITGGNFVAGKLAVNGVGENIYVGGAASVVSITGGTFNGGVYAANFASFTVGGNPVISAGTTCGLKLAAGKLLTLAPVESDAKVAMTDFGVFATSEDAALLQSWQKQFTAIPEETVIRIDGQDLVVGYPSRCALGHQAHEGDTAECPAPILNWDRWTSTTALPTEAGNYVLTGDLSIANNQTISQNINLDLNGHTVTVTVPANTAWVERRFAAVAAGATVGVTDLSEEKTGKVVMVMNGQTSCDGAIFLVNGNLNLYGGLLDGSNFSSNCAGGTAICVRGGNFTMYGGTIKGVYGANKADGNTHGSTISGYADSTVNIHGGELIGSVGRLGGNIFVQCDLTITGGKFTGGTLAPKGVANNICAIKSSTLTNSAKIVITGDAEIDGGIYMEGVDSLYVGGSVKLDPVEGSKATYALNLHKDVPVVDENGTVLFTVGSNGQTDTKYYVLYNGNGEVMGICPVDDTTAASALQVGYGRVDITPTANLPLAGYGNTSERVSENVLDNLYVTCVAMTDAEGNTVLLYTQDTINSSVYNSNTLRADIASATGVAADNIIVAATHTHSAPDATATTDATTAWKTQYKLAMIEAANAALADRKAAEMYSGTVATDGMNFTRHYVMEDGTVSGSNFGNYNLTPVSHQHENDPVMQVVKFDREGENDVFLMNFQAHPTMTGGQTAPDISADFIGAVRSYVEANVEGANFAYFTGATGNEVTESRLENEMNNLEMDAYGQKLGKYLVDLIPELTKVNTTVIKNAKQTFTYAIDHSYDDKLEQAKEVIDVWKNGAGKWAARELAHSYGFSSEYHASAIISRVNMAETASFDISAVSIGDFAMIVAPYEMFSVQGMELKAQSPYGMTFVVTCANGGNGYMAPADAYDYMSYESTTCKFAKGVTEALTDSYLKLLLQLKNQ